MHGVIKERGKIESPKLGTKTAMRFLINKNGRVQWDGDETEISHGKRLIFGF